MALLVVAMIGPAPGAVAFAPEASVMIARRVLADWSSPPGGWDALLASALTAQSSREIANGEEALRLRRFHSGAQSSCASVHGEAPFEFARAVERLGTARWSGDASAIAAAALWVATLASDLADPFQMVAPLPTEVPGARAAFSDAGIASAWTITGLTRPPDSLLPSRSGSNRPTQGSALENALVLAVASAALRDSAERLAVVGPSAELAALQQSCLGAALDLTQRAVQAMAGSPGTRVAGRLDVWPTPSHAGTRVAFKLGEGGPAIMEIFDPSGRLVTMERWGRLASGVHVRWLETTQTSELPPGVYFLRLTVGSTRLHGQLVRLGR